MDITSAVFVKGIKGTDKILYNGKRQIAFVGRSNVGKSSLINTLTNRHGLARSSSQPGKTVRLDFFLINDSFYFVDLPGYGYAHMPRNEHEDIRKMMLWYLEFSEVKNRFVVLIIDANIGLTPFDQEMMGILQAESIPFCIAANKIDKIVKNKRNETIENIQKHCENVKVIPFSTKTKEGKKELSKILLWKS